MPAPPRSFKPLWVTSFAADMYKVSGAEMLQSFLANNNGQDMLVCTEGPLTDTLIKRPLLVYPLEQSQFLKEWLAANSDIIPEHLGGKHDGICRCSHGPFPVHSKKHKQPCVGAWFNRNSSRWFRKTASLYQAREIIRAATGIYTAVIWIDADCVFRARLTGLAVQEWFRLRKPSPPAAAGTVRHRVATPLAGAFYLKSRRPVMETGCFGFNLLAGGQLALDGLIARFTSGQFRKDIRWDDSYQLQRTLEELTQTRKLTAVDLAYSVGNNAGVFEHSALRPFIEHRKGRHSRQMGVMT